MKADIFHAMNEISDKYVIEAAACIETRKKNAAAAFGKTNLTQYAVLHKSRWISRTAVVIIVVMALFTMTGIAYAAVGEKVMEWFYDLFHAELVTTENQAFIGKEVINNNMPEIIRSKEAQTHTAGQNDSAQDHLAENIAECQIVDRFRTNISNRIYPGRIVYEGKVFKELNGCYKLSVREDGKYNLYVINAASDYLTLKQSTITYNY